MKEERPLKVSQLARRYGLRTITIRDWLRNDLLVGDKVNEQWRIFWDAVFDFEGRMPPAPGPVRDVAKEDLWTMKKAADYLQSSPETVRVWIRSGQLAGRKIMTRLYTDRVSVEAFLRSRRATWL